MGLLMFLLPTENAPRSIALPATQFNSNNVEISGLGVYNNQLLALSEGCGKLFRIPLNGCDGACDEIEMVGQHGRDLEGMAIYNNYLFVTNEDAPAGIQFAPMDKLQAANKLHFKPVFTVAGNEKFDLSKHTGDYGLEGIAINKDKAIAYIIKERSSKDGKKNYSMLWSFAITTIKGQMVFNHLSTTKITQEGRFRYSDAFFHNQKLYCIRSDGKEFFIDVISKPETLGDKISTTHPQIRNVSITSEVNQVKGNLSDRLEGIAITGGKIYLMSDTGSGKCDKKAPKGTLLMEMDLF